MTVKRWTLVTAGVAGGIALGVTGYASAAGSPSPVPTHPPKAQDGRAPGAHGPEGGRARGFGGPGARAGRGGAAGLVTAIGAGSITVRTRDGETKKVALSGATTYYEGTKRANHAAISVGEIVMLRLADPQATSPVASTVTVLPAHLAGFVTKVDDTTITVTDESGFTRTIRTSRATTYKKDGAAGKRSDISVGALVRALGSVDADGTTLDATTVAVGRPPRGDRPGPGAQPGAFPGNPPPGEGVDG
ncbi:MAG: hypothetical protein JWO12_276 [Frankiales bacterium]|nr:hypothetical protein [Frankiales bacterium]